MKMKKFFAVMLLMIMAFSTSALKAQSMGPMPIDDQVRIGKLDCGLTYYIRHNNYPEKRVNFYIAQRVGSIQEEESQRGLAHFLEHMAFNGSEHFNGEGKGIIDYTRSLGVAFGKDLNAYTMITETVYNINDVPSARQSAIDSCLLILKDWSGGLLLTDEEIDKERGVIHEEWRLRRDAQQRMLENQLEALYPGSKYGRRMPIGLMDVVDNFKYDELRNYYHKWYRPDNQALVIVGDVDVDHIEAQIKELFKNVPAPGPDAAQVVDEPVPDNENPIVVVDKDKEQPYSMVYTMFKRDAFPKEIKNDQSYLILDFAIRMIGDMLNNRLEEKSKEPDCPYIQAIAMDGGYLLANNVRAFNLINVPKEGMTEAATQAVLTEALRAAQYGFTATEFERAKEEYLSKLEKRYNERDNITNEDYGRQYCRHYLDNDPIPSIEDKYNFMSMYVPQIPVEVVNQFLPVLITPGGENLVVMNFNPEKEGAVYPTPETLLAAVNAAENAELEPYVDDVKQEPLISTLPKPGKIKKEKYNSQFDYKELELSNGARVILKKTDFNNNEIKMRAIARGGQSLYTEKDWENINMSPIISMVSGLGNFSATELQKAMAGKRAELNFGMDTYTDEFEGESTVKELETLLQLTYLKFTDLRKDEKSYNQFMTLIKNSLKDQELDPEKVFSDSVDYILGNHNWRNKPFHADDIDNVNYDRALQILKERTANAANYTFYFVGNFDEQVIRPLIEQYIASLPGKKGKLSKWVNVETHPVGETIAHFTRKMETPKANARMYWYDTKTPYSLENSIKAEILGKVLEKIYLQKIREDAGAAYSAGASGLAIIDGDSPWTRIMAYSPVKPEMADMALQIMKDEMVNVGKSIDATTLKEIKELMIKEYNTEIKKNNYWMDVISTYVTRGIDDHTGYEQIVNAQTPETIAAFARQMLATGNRLEIVMLPEQ